MLLTVSFAFAQSLKLYERGTTTKAKSNYTFKINNASVKSTQLSFDCKNTSTTKDIPVRVKVTLFE